MCYVCHATATSLNYSLFYYMHSTLKYQRKLFSKVGQGKSFFFLVCTYINYFTCIRRDIYGVSSKTREGAYRDVANI